MHEGIQEQGQEKTSCHDHLNFPSPFMKEKKKDFLLASLAKTNKQWNICPDKLLTGKHSRQSH